MLALKNTRLQSLFSGQLVLIAFLCCFLETSARSAKALSGARACGLLLAGVAAMGSALAAPPLYLCPGNLFSNHLEPAQARAMGCALATPGRMSQAHDAPSASVNPDHPASLSNPNTLSNDAKVTAPATASAALGAAPPPTVTAAAMPPPARKPGATVGDAAQQRARDSDAKEILRSELARTQAQLQALMEQTPSGPETDSAVQRLRADEAALRRELARLPS